MKRDKARPAIERAKRSGEPLRVREDAGPHRQHEPGDAGNRPAIRTVDLDSLELELEGMELESDHGGYDPYDKKLTEKPSPPAPRRTR